MHYYKHHLGDYARDTVGLSLIEHGAYRLLIDAYYSSEQPIDQAEAYAITKAGTAVEKKAVDRVLSKYFHRKDGHWVHNRIDREVTEYQRKATVNASNGSHGGRPKTNRNNNPDETGSVISGLEDGNPNHNPNPPPEITLASNHKPVTKKKRVKTPLAESFGLSERVIDWAKGKGYGRLQEHLDAFRLKAVANGYCYVDWDAALMQAIESDWARLNTRPMPDPFKGGL